MGWILMMLLMINSMRARPTPSQGSCHQRNAAAGLPMFIMMRVRVSGMSSRFSSGFERQHAVIDITLIPLGTGDGDLLPVAEHIRALAGPDDGGNAQLAADNRGMRGTSTIIRDDACRPAHDRHPIRVGHLGHQNRAILELVDILALLIRQTLPAAMASPMLRPVE